MTPWQFRPRLYGRMGCSHCLPRSPLPLPPHSQPVKPLQAAPNHTALTKPATPQRVSTSKTCQPSPFCTTENLGWLSQVADSESTSNWLLQQTEIKKTPLHNITQQPTTATPLNTQLCTLVTLLQTCLLTSGGSPCLSYKKRVLVMDLNTGNVPTPFKPCQVTTTSSPQYLFNCITVWELEHTVIQHKSSFKHCSGT